MLMEGIYSCSSTLARRDWIQFPYASLSRRSTSGVSTGNVLGYCRNLGSWDTERVLRTLPCQVAARLSRRFSRSNLRILWRNDRLYSQMPCPFGGDLAGIVAIGLCSSAADPLVRFLPLHEPIVVQFHCVIEWDFSSGEKRLFPICVFIKMQYSFRISGNRGYDSNQVRFVPLSCFFLYVLK